MADALALRLGAEMPVPAPGAGVTLFLPPERCVLFADDGAALARP
jgi:multiple sugar transport system ATP-binding protein